MLGLSPHETQEPRFTDVRGRSSDGWLLGPSQGAESFWRAPALGPFHVSFLAPRSVSLQQRLFPCSDESAAAVDVLSHAAARPADPGRLAKHLRKDRKPFPTPAHAPTSVSLRIRVAASRGAAGLGALFTGPGPAPLLTRERSPWPRPRRAGPCHAGGRFQTAFPFGVPLFEATSSERYPSP